MDTVKPRRILIGTPCYDGRVDVWYANSMLDTVKMGLSMNIEVFPVYLSYDALIQRARNDLVAIALQLDCDDLVFIDSDIEWRAEDFYKLLSYPVDVVGGTYPKKGDAEMYVAKVLDSTRRPDQHGLIEAEGLGTGFLRLSRKALDYLWESSVPYEEKDSGKIRRWIFDVIVHEGELYSEDIYVCERLREGGIKIYLDPKITCNHVGMKKYTGNFETWYNKLQEIKKQDHIKALYS